MTEITHLYLDASFIDASTLSTLPIDIPTTPLEDFVTLNPYIVPVVGEATWSEESGVTIDSSAETIQRIKDGLGLTLPGSFAVFRTQAMAVDEYLVPFILSEGPVSGTYLGTILKNCGQYFSLGLSGSITYTTETGNTTTLALSDGVITIFFVHSSDLPADTDPVLLDTDTVTTLRDSAYSETILTSTYVYKQSFTPSTPIELPDHRIVFITETLLSPPALQPPSFSFVDNPHTLEQGAVDVYYHDTIGTLNGAEPISTSIVAGSLPTGLYYYLGTIGGLPTTEETATFTVRATNIFGSVEQIFSIQILAHIAPSWEDPILATQSCNAGGVGRWYSLDFTAIGTTPITYSVSSGSLPPGLSMPSNGNLRGNPTTLGTYTFTILAHNDYGDSEKSFTINIISPPTWDAYLTGTNTLIAGRIGIPYSLTLSAAVGTNVWYSGGGFGFPPGLTFHADTRIISGTPTGTGGDYYFSILAGNAAGNVSKSFLIGIGNIPSFSDPGITTIPGGAIGHSYGYVVVANGSTPLSYTVDSGILPPGLSLATNGYLTGDPTTIGTYIFNVRANNSIGSAIHTYSLEIGGAPEFVDPADTIILDNGQVSILYETTLAVTGTSPILFDILGGSLPPGLSLSADGIISGTPSGYGNFEVLIRISNDFGATSRTHSISIISPPSYASYPTSPTALAIAQMEEEYSASVAATGSLPITYALIGTLPDGLSLSADGTITGIPSERGTFQFSVLATNTSGSDSHLFVVMVGVAPSFVDSSPEIVLPNGILNSVYAATVLATGETPITYEITDGVFPAGITLATDGTISGTPTDSGYFSVVIKAENIYGFVSKTHLLVIFQAPYYSHQTDPTPLSPGRITTPYSASVAANGTSPITHTLNVGTLPLGLSLSSDGNISGTPSQVESTSFSISATNYAGTIQHGFSLDITAIPPEFVDGPGPVILQSGELGIYYQHTYEITGDPPITFAIHSGSLPPGLSLSEDGAITGYPSGLGTYVFTTQASNPAATVEQIGEITIELPDALEVESLPINSSSRPTRIETDVQYAQLDPTDDARVEIWVCNNANDVEKSWEAINTDMKMHSFTNKRKELSSDWGCSIKIRITRVGTSQIALYSYGFRFEK